MIGELVPQLTWEVHSLAEFTDMEQVMAEKSQTQKAGRIVSCGMRYDVPSVPSAEPSAAAL